jgi:hypothetical protein
MRPRIRQLVGQSQTLRALEFILLLKCGERRPIPGVKSETTLAKVRLHWGVFIPVILVTMVMSFAGFMLTIFLHFVGQAFNPSNQPLPWLPLLMMLMMLATPAVFLFVQAWLFYSKSEVTLTDRRLIFSMGIFYARMSGELPLENIETIFIFESVLGRIFGWGTVQVTSIGGRTFPLRYISSPHVFHAALQKAVADAKATTRPASKPAMPPQDDDSRYMPKI